MRGVIAYFSKFGNGKRVAEAMSRGLKESGQDVTVVELPGPLPEGEFDFFIVSSPTRMGRATGPAKRFVSKLKKNAGKPFVAIGTGVHPGKEPSGKRSDAWPAGSADKLYERMQNAGLKPLMEPQKFWVANADDWKNANLEEGEEERAAEVGREIARQLSANDSGR